MNTIVDLEPCAFAFQTERLSVRPLNEGDEALFCALYTDAETMRFIDPPMTPEQAAKSFRKTLALMRKRPMQWLFLTIVEKSTQLPIGICGVPNFDGNAAQLEIGMMLSPKACTQGFAREGLAALARKLFLTLAVDEIWVEYPAAHAAAAGLVRSIGFSPPSEISAPHSKKLRGSVSRSRWYRQNAHQTQTFGLNSVSAEDGIQCPSTGFDHVPYRAKVLDNGERIC